MKYSASVSRASGFTMIELLVAVVVFSIGLIGIAGMQATALGLTHDSQVTVRASNLTADILEKIRLNPTARRAGHYNDISGTQTAPSCVTTTDAQGDTTTDPSNTGACTAEELAQLDAWLWMEEISDSLPSGSGEVKFDNDIYTVTVTWKEKQNGTVVDQTYQAGTYL